MSTFIKVTQEGSQLLRRNTEQTQGRRLAKLEADEQRRTQQDARAARQKALQQQGKDANGDVAGDARRRRFRLDEPAATAISSPSLLITWKDSGPVLNDKNAELIYDNDPDRSKFMTTITVGAEVPALGQVNLDTEGSIPAKSEWVYATRQYQVKQRSDFTYEAWGQLVPRINRANIGIYTSFRSQQGFLEDAYLAVYYTDIAIEEGTYISFRYSVEGPVSLPIRLSTLPPEDPVHLCIMRKSEVVRYFFNGSLIYSIPFADDEYDSSFATQIGFFLESASGTPTSKLGPLRFTPNRARYNPAGFTPNSLPFRP